MDFDNDRQYHSDIESELNEVFGEEHQDDHRQDYDHQIALFQLCPASKEYTLNKKMFEGYARD